MCLKVLAVFLRAAPKQGVGRGHVGLQILRSDYCNSQRELELQPNRGISFFLCTVHFVIVFHTNVM